MPNTHGAAPRPRSRCVSARAIALSGRLPDEPAPGPHAYTAFMAWLAPRFGGRGGRRLPGRLRGVGCQLRPDEPRPSRPLRAEKATAFFDLFAASPAGFEDQATGVVADGLACGVDPRLIKRAARLLQGYEKLYWDTLHAPSGA